MRRRERASPEGAISLQLPRRPLACARRQNGLAAAEGVGDTGPTAAGRSHHRETFQSSRVQIQSRRGAVKSKLEFVNVMRLHIIIFYIPNSKTIPLPRARGARAAAPARHPTRPSGVVTLVTRVALAGPAARRAPPPSPVRRGRAVRCRTPCARLRPVRGAHRRRARPAGAPATRTRPPAHPGLCWRLRDRPTRTHHATSTTPRHPTLSPRSVVFFSAPFDLSPRTRPPRFLPLSTLHCYLSTHAPRQCPRPPLRPQRSGVASSP